MPLQNPQLKKIAEFIKEHHLAALATVSADFLPEAAVMGIYANDDLEIFFGTTKASRKYENLLRNPRVALVIGWDKGKTVQYEGAAAEMSPEASEEMLKTAGAALPSAAKYVHPDEAAYFKVSPKWVRYSDSSRDPIESYEAAL